MGIDHRMQYLQGVRAALSVVTTPLYYVAQLPADLISGTAEHLASREHLLAENTLLKDENQKLRGRMLRFESLEAENIRLRGQLGATLRLGDRVSLAEIAAVDLDPYKHQLLINKGTLAGVFPGQAVVDSRAVMGQVTHVSPFTANVLLITDTRHSLPVKVLRNGLRTIAVGTGKTDRLELPYVLPNADIKEGDLLVTSGLGEHFPPDYPVARVVSVDTSRTGLFGRVIAEPLAKLGRAQEVMLVWSITPNRTALADTQAQESTEGTEPQVPDSATATEARP